MRELIRQTLRWVMIGGVLSVTIVFEQSVGLPVLSIILLLLLVRQEHNLVQLFWVWWVSLLIMSLFVLSWTVCLLIIGGAWWWWQTGRPLVSSDTVRLMSGATAAAVGIGGLSPGYINQFGLVYVGLVTLVTLLVVKRERLQPRQGKQIG